MVAKAEYFDRISRASARDLCRPPITPPNQSLPESAHNLLHVLPAYDSLSARHHLTRLSVEREHRTTPSCQRLDNGTSTLE